MNRRVSPLPAASLPPAAADSSARATVVPTAITRPPAARHFATAATSSAETSKRSACITCSEMSSTRSGWKVPAPDMQGDLRARDAQRVDARHQLRIEMQAGRGCGDRAGNAGEDALVALDVGLIRGPRDVGRQRRRAVCLEERQHLGGRFDFPEIAVFVTAVAGDHRHRSAIGVDDHPFADGLAGPQLRQRAPLADGPLQEHLDAPARILGAEQARRNHARVIEHQQVAGSQQRWQVGELQIAQLRHWRRPAPAAGCRNAQATAPARSARGEARSGSLRGARAAHLTRQSSLSGPPGSVTSMFWALRSR